jgi:hypothetical protein
MHSTSMRAMSLLLATALATGCAVQAPAGAPGAAPAPHALSTPHPPAAVLNMASQALAARGFEITERSAARGLIEGQVTRLPHEHGRLVACDPASPLMGVSRTTLVATVRALPGDDGSTVEVRVRAITRKDANPGMFKAGQVSATACVSTGALEEQLVEALQ